MKTRRLLGAGFALLSAALLMGADGAWLDRISPRDHARVNPLIRDAQVKHDAVGAGAQAYRAECAKCHGEDGRGLHGRPAVISRRVSLASDGDLFWLMNNGVPWKGMPPWMMLPEKERWQLVSYLRSLNETPLAAADGNASPSQLKGASR
jgi:mono/diheme cytochrome c family protein